MTFQELPGIMTHVLLFDREPVAEAMTLIRSSVCVANVLSRLFWQARWPQEPWSAAAAANPDRRDQFAQAADNAYRAMIIFPESRFDLLQAVQPVVDEMTARGLKFTVEPVGPEDLIMDNDKVGLIQARLFRMIGHMLLHDIPLTEPVVSKILDDSRYLSHGLLLQRVGFFRKEYPIGFLHQASRDDLLHKARIRQPRYIKVSEILAAMHAASNTRDIQYL